MSFNPAAGILGRIAGAVAAPHLGAIDAAAGPGRLAGTILVFPHPEPSPRTMAGRGHGLEEPGRGRPDRDRDGANATDLDLANRLRAGDDAALAALYDRYAGAVHGVMRAILRDDHLAEEGTHDVFLQLWQHPAAYDAGRGPFAPWLLRIARNRGIDLLRRRREHPFAGIRGEGEAAEVDAAAWVVDPDPDPAEQAIGAALRRDVRHALGHLSPEQRRLLELAYFGGLSQREIALRLDRPLGTVKTQIRTAMRRLADVVAAVDPDLNRGAGPSGDRRWANGGAR